MPERMSRRLGADHLHYMQLLLLKEEAIPMDGIPLLVLHCRIDAARNHS